MSILQLLRVLSNVEYLIGIFIFQERFKFQILDRPKISFKIQHHCEAVRLHF